MKEKFEDWRPSSKTLETVENAVQIISEYEGEGYILNLRQLYYRFVALDLFPEDRRWLWLTDKRKWVKDPGGTKNADPNYKWIGGIISRGRLAGIIDWSMIEDQNRSIQKNGHWRNPEEILNIAARTFQLDKWEDQDYRIIVMCEKAALAGILLPICEELDVPFTANKGYSSQSHLYRIGKQLSGYYYDKHQTPVVLYFGDHDSSGLDMDRDIYDRLSLFGELEIEVIRLALTMPQIKEYQPPPNPTKMTDTRAKAYIASYGNESWELDAMEPRRLAELVRGEIEKYRDDGKWDFMVERENDMKTKIKEFAETFGDAK